MNHLSDKTLSQIVSENYQAARVFEKYGLDFCCKGKRPLAVACMEKEIGLESLIDELNSVISRDEAGTDFNTMSLTELTQHIEQVHHSYVKRNMPQIFSYVLRVASKHGDRFPYMKEVYVLFADLQEELEQHMTNEEKVLFPALQKFEKEGKVQQSLEVLQDAIEILEDDHTAAGSIMQQIRSITNNYTPPPQACTTHHLTIAALKGFEEDLHQHVHLENNILFPKAMETYRKIHHTAIS